MTSAVRFACLWLLCGAAARSARVDGRGVYRLLVLHTNDMHARFDQTDRTGAQCAAASSRCYGGFARVKTAADRARASSHASHDGALFLNAGDTFQGTAFYTYLKWPAVARMIRPLGIDVMCLGNHEFDDGVKSIRSFIRNITVPVVASNLDLANEPSLANEPNLMKSTVLTVNGRKIGIIGYLTPETANTSTVENVRILPEIPSVAAEAKRLKKDGVDILIALGHSGFETDVEIARQVDDVDLVIGGHSNTFLYSGTPPDVEKPVGPYPFWVEQPNTRRRVPVVQAFHVTKYLGQLWLEFDEAGEVVKSYGNPILLDSSVEQDPELLYLTRDFEKTIENKTRRVVGTSSVFLDGVDVICRLRECNMGNFITDSFVNYNLRRNIKSFDLSKHWTDAPIALIQSGGIRSNINHVTKNGSITFGDLVTSLPFRNDMGKITTKGSDIWTAFEFSVRRYDNAVGRGEFLQVSGLKVVIDLGRPSGQRVQSILARCGNCTAPVYRQLDPNGNYTVIMSRYLADGGDGIEFTKVVAYRSFGTSELDIVIEEIGLRSPIWPEVDRRIVLLNADKLPLQRQSSGSGCGGGRTLSTLTLLSSTIVSTVLRANGRWPL